MTRLICLKPLRQVLSFNLQVLSFNLQVSTDQCGHVKTSELKHGGANIPVTSKNKKGR